MKSIFSPLRVALLLVCAILSSCTEDNTSTSQSITASNRIPWQLVEKVNGLGRFTMNCYADNMRLYAFGSGRLYQKDTNGIEQVSYMLNGGQNRWKTPMSSSLLPIYSYEADYGISVYSMRSTDITNTSTISIPWDTFIQDDSLKSAVQFFASNDLSREVGAINDLTHQILLPISAPRNNYVFYLLGFSFASDASIMLSNTKVIEFEGVKKSSYPFIWSFFGKFYVYVSTPDAQLYIIDSTGAYQKNDINFHPSHMFRFGNTLFASEYYSLFRSVDFGETWQKIYNVNFNADNSSYIVVKDSIFMFLRDNIHHIQFTPQGFTALPLDNTEFKGSIITGLTCFRDTAYISTTIGLFRKPWINLFDTTNTNKK